MIFTKNQTIQQIERILEKSIQDVVVVSEIPMQQKDFELLLRRLKSYSTTNEEETRILNLWNFYPNVCVVITVFIAVYEYKNNFWSQFTEITGIENANKWREEFWNFVQFQNKQTFREKSRRKYVNTILGHAGIPYHCVPKFMTNAIIPAINRGLNEIDIYHNSKRKEYDGRLNKGVISFIELGEKVSFSIIQRIQNVWRSREKPFADTFNGYLPQHILQAMDYYNPTADERFIDFKRPNIHFDSLKREILLKIPKIRIGKDSNSERFNWEIIDKTNNKRPYRINMDRLTYKIGDIKELIPKQHEYSLFPNQRYKIRLNDEENSEVIYEEELLIEPILIQFNNENRFVHLSGVYLDKEYESVSLIIGDREISKIKESIKTASMQEIKLKGIWRKYTKITIAANGKESIIVGQSIIKLNTSIHPKIEGETQEHLVHVDYPLFKEMPYLVIPDHVVNDILVGNLNHILLRNLSTNQSKLKNINGSSIKKVDNETRIYLDNIKLKQDESLNHYELLLSGKLGFDYSFRFILLKDFSIKLNTGIVNLKIPDEYTLIIQWPLDIETFQSGGIYQINATKGHFKLLISLFNKITHTKNDFILYTSMYNIRFVGNGNCYPVGSEMERERWNNHTFEIEVDTTNPAFEYEIGKQTNFEIKGGKVKFSNNLTSNSVYYFSDDMFDKEVKENQFYKYRFFSAMKKHKPLLTIRNMWDMENLDWNLKGRNLSLKWEQSNYVNEKLIRIWKLNKPFEQCTDIPLGKRSRTFSYKFSEPGIYMLEWKDYGPSGINMPSFEEGKYKIFSVGTNQTLSALLLLTKEEFENSEIIELLKVIDHFGEKYLSLLTEDYDSCCDFGIRIGNELEKIIFEKKLNKRYIHILTRITGIQELDKKNLFNIYKDFLNENCQDEFVSLKGWYFCHDRMIKSFRFLNKSQLNIKMQEIELSFPIINGFCLPKELVRFLYKMKNGKDYANYVNNMSAKNCIDKKGSLSYYYHLLELKNRKYFRVFNQIESRNYKNKFGDFRGKPFEYLDYPLFLGRLALLNCAFVEMRGEDVFEEDGRKLVRELTKEVLQHDRDWFLHDLFYISLAINQLNMNKR